MNEILFPLSITLVVILPLLCAAAIAIRSTDAVAFRLAPWMALPALVLAVFVPEDTLLRLPGLLLGTQLGLADETGRLFLLFTALLWWLAGMYAQSYLSDPSGRKRFFLYYLLSMTGNFGLILAQDVASFYLFFTLMSFASYGLVIHERSIAALRAGRIYIILVLIGEVMLFAAMVMATASAGSNGFDDIRKALVQAESRDLIIFLALIGFGIKAGVLGLHVWLPLAHPVAPTPASAVLSGAMIKAGLLGWLRLLPLGEVAFLSWGDAFIALGLATAFYGVLIGLTQRDPKTLLAYSSISQMGILTTAVGIGLTAPDTYPAMLTVITLYAMHHGLNKGALFLGVGLIGACSGTQRRWVGLALLLPALALAGAPFTSGMVTKVLLKAQVSTAPTNWVPVLEILLPCSAVATTLLVGRFLWFLAISRSGASDKPAPVGLVWPWALLIALALALPWWFVAKSPFLWSQSALVSSLWPVLLGIVLIGMAVVWQSRLRRKPGVTPLEHEQRSRESLQPSIPPGDILAPISRVVNVILAHGHRLAVEQLPRWRAAGSALLDRQRSNLIWSQIYKRIEPVLNNWHTGLTVLLLLGLLLAYIGSTG